MSTLDEFIRTEKFTNPIKDLTLRNELLLDFDNFNQPKVEEEYHALAQTILNLLLLEPGTYTNDPEMGINIAKYQFEFLTPEIISKIQTEINTQVNKYIPSNNIQKVIVVENTNKNTNQKELIIGFAVGKIDASDGSISSVNFFIKMANDEIQGINSKILFTR